MNRVVSARRAARHGCRLYSSSASEAWDGPFFRLQKRWGQHLLTNPRVLDAIVRRAAIRPGDAVLKGSRHDARLKAFFVFNTTAFVASLLIIIILLDKKLTFSPNVRSGELYVFIALTLIGLVGAYSAGSCRQVDTTIYVNSLIGAVIACILLQAAAIKFCKAAIKNLCSCVSVKQQQTPDPNTSEVSGWLRRIKQFCLCQTTQDPSTGNDDARY